MFLKVDGEAVDDMDDEEKLNNVEEDKDKDLGKQTADGTGTSYDGGSEGGALRAKKRSTTRSGTRKTKQSSTRKTKMRDASTRAEAKDGAE